MATASGGDTPAVRTPGGAFQTPEHVLVDFPIPNPYDGPLSTLLSGSIFPGPNPGYVWTRFTITEQPLGQGWTGEGVFEDGESEDYLLRIDATPPPDLDFGDADDPTYPTLLANDGARHTIVPGYHLGASIDAEPNGQPDPAALGDDNDGNDDEDGITFTTTPLIPGQQAIIDITTSSTVVNPQTGFLDGWIDFNGDGDWADTGEQVFTSYPLSILGIRLGLRAHPRHGHAQHHHLRPLPLQQHGRPQPHRCSPATARSRTTPCPSAKR